MNIIFPSDTFDGKKVDSDLKDQFEAAIGNDFGVGLVDLSNNKFRVVNPPKINEGWIYRGWMLNGQKYISFYSELLTQGIKLLIDCDEYLESHHISGWLEKLDGITPKTVLFKDRNDFVTEIAKVKFSPWFIKDYVKSLKTKRGSIAHNIEEAVEILNEIEKYRGELEGGIAVRQCMDFIPSTERRYFIFNSRPVNLVFPEDKNIINDVIYRLSCKKFYSVDVIQDASGKEWVVEIGDGQVSDLVGGIESTGFYGCLKNIA